MHINIKNSNCIWLGYRQENGQYWKNGSKVDLLIWNKGTKYSKVLIADRTMRQLLIFLWKFDLTHVNDNELYNRIE